MADEPDVQAPEITPEDFMADEQAEAKVAPSAAKEEAKAEPKVPEQAKDEEAKPSAAPSEAVKDEESKEADESTPDAEKPEDKPKGLEKRTEQVNAEIRDLVAERNRLKEEVAKANAEVYQPASEKDLTEQGMTDIEAKVEAMRQEQEMEKYNSQVADAQLTIGSEANRVLNDFPIFNPDSEIYDKELAEDAAALLDANLIKDQNTGQIIGSNVSPYQLYKTLARASGISATKGQIQGQKAVEKQLANVDNNTSAAPAKKAVDPVIALWTEDD